MSQYPKVCVIGAGSSGIATCKVLHERGIPFDCFEKSDRIGGNWVFNNQNGWSSAYRSLHINTSKAKMAYSDYPMPEDFPDFPHHSQLAQYFNDYVDRFGFRDKITFNMAVTHVERTEDGIWQVKLENNETREYDALCVVNGHHWDARWPDPAFSGRFDGQQIHSHNYIDPTEPIDCKDKNVLIVGFGNSALDIACELGRKGVAKNVFVSIRRGYWVVPKYLGSKVLDSLLTHPSEDPNLLQRMIPDGVLRWVFQKMVERTAGRPEDYGLPKPDHKFMESHPAVSSEIYIRVGSGDVQIRPNIKRLKGDHVEFEDGRMEDIDAIIYATGYKINFPFFDPAFLSAPDNDIALWQRMMDPRYPNLFMVALVQPLCAMMPIAEEQSKVIASYLTGEYALPDPDQMEQERVEMHQRIKDQYVATPRHTIQINCGEYTYGLRKEQRRGMKRAKQTGNPLPILPRADGSTETAE
jgi:dimethylaniline monooxygenase (N-oxide forming)